MLLLCWKHLAAPMNTPQTLPGYGNALTASTAPQPSRSGPSPIRSRYASVDLLGHPEREHSVGLDSEVDGVVAPLQPVVAVVLDADFSEATKDVVPFSNRRLGLTMHSDRQLFAR